MTDFQGEKFQKFLNSKGISVLEASKRLGVSRQTVYQYFRSSSLERETVNKILTVFNTSAAEVFNDHSNFETERAIGPIQENTSNKKEETGGKYVDKLISRLEKELEFKDTIIKEKQQQFEITVSDKDKIIARTEESLELWKCKALEYEKKISTDSSAYGTTIPSQPKIRREQK